MKTNLTAVAFGCLSVLACIGGHDYIAGWLIAIALFAL